MGTKEFYVYLLNVRVAVIRAESARDAIRRAEFALTKVSAGMGGTRVSHGMSYDAIAMRVHALETIRARRGKELHESVRVLRDFRDKLDACGLGSDEAGVLWMKSVLGMRNSDAIAKALNIDPRHVWPMFRAARDVLAESLGVAEPSPDERSVVVR